MKEYSRRDERIHLMQSFYQVFLFIENKEDYDATEILCLNYDVDEYDECPVYSELVYALGLSHFDEIKKELQKHLVNWTFDRLDNVAKGILFVAYTEGVYVKKAPRKVIINEAVALAKNFLKANDYKFINAVLDKAIPIE
ncbi:MAG: transcription antitermination factor NusB [Candidatus Enterosoma sp.]|nr:transcription antitermination factor NusB [bacterium]MDY3210585.1 transcription antitermination factor NusB [Candidatus Enterosoma sp.]MDY5322113.1 transcription antitermination factor NusB [Candidatus Enterosoma sp.]